MLSRIKLSIKAKLSNNQNSFFEGFRNKKVINSFNKIYNETKLRQRKYKSLLIDGGYYNLNYFYRIQLLRSAIRSSELKENAFIWDCNINICRNILNSIGVKNISYFPQDFNKEIFRESESLAKKIKTRFN